ncbi:MAG: ribonuclease PH [Syntrophales bacterium]|nr:ribonuclease PH [Syntrophales bacterium]
MAERRDRRKFDQLRPLKIKPGYLSSALGSALIEMGNTRVICAASLEGRVPDFLKNTGGGWLTAEYSMLPAATPRRSVREVMQGRQGGRTQEIQRLIGRSLRAVTDLSLLGERTIYIDCDVIEADGGTRTASITGSFVALAELFKALKIRGDIDVIPFFDSVAAVSVGVLNGEILLDLDYEEDSRADVDANFVITGRGSLVEVQVTAEGAPFERSLLEDMMALAEKGAAELTMRQKSIEGAWM